MEEGLVCVGHSHTAALKSGAAQIGMPVDVINFWETGEPWVRDNGTARLRPDLADRVRRGKRVVLAIGGNAHMTLGTVEHPRPFDFVLPDDPHLEVNENLEILPAEAMRVKTAELGSPYFIHLPAVMALTTGPLVHLGPPPPVADEKWVMEHVLWDFHPNATRKISSKWVRYKFWRLHCDLIRSICATNGISYLSAPEAAMDAEGFLAMEYAHDEAHGNAAYGALVLEALRLAA